MKHFSFATGAALVAVLCLSPTQIDAFTPNGLRSVSVVGPQRETALMSTPTEKDLERFQSYGEASRKFRRSYFTHSDWLKARRDDRFVYNLNTILTSGIARQLAKEIGIIAGISAFIVVWNCLLVAGFDDFSGVHHNPIFNAADLIPLLKLPSDPFTLSSPALGLLLVFRTNTSYSRWDEGRKAWGAIINNSRTAARLGTTWADPTQQDSKEKLERLADTVWAFPRSLTFHLLGPLEDGSAYAKDLSKLKDREFAADLLRVRHKPTRALKEMTDALADIQFKSIIYQAEAEKAVTALCDALGACERIFTSPVPVFYSRHTSRFLINWLFLMPLALYKPFDFTWNHWGMIPAAVVLSYFLLGIEELVSIERRICKLPKF
jgi:putative membrane protein